MTKNELYYVAGLLEGEGCFQWQNSTKNGKRLSYGTLLIDLKMADEDIIEHYRQITRATAKINHHKPSRPTSKMQYGQRIYGFAAAALMKKLLPLMGARRSQKIRSLLERWNNRPAVTGHYWKVVP